MSAWDRFIQRATSPWWWERQITRALVLAVIVSMCWLVTLVKQGSCS